MSKSDEEFQVALQGKKIPILPLDNKWYKLLSGLDKPTEMKEMEEQLKNLLKLQGRYNNESKQIRRTKNRLMDEIVAAMDTPDGAMVQEKNKQMVEQLNQKQDEIQDKLLELPKQIQDVNYELMLQTMALCYDVIADNTKEIEEFTDWIAQIRVELKKKVIMKQERELRNQEIYQYMHAVFGPEVIDLFDLKYNPGQEHVINTDS